MVEAARAVRGRPARHRDDVHRRQHGAAARRDAAPRRGAEQPVRPLQPRRRRGPEPRRAEAAARVPRRGAAAARDLGAGARARASAASGRFGIEMPINVFADEVLTPGEGQIKALDLRRRQSGRRVPGPAARSSTALRALELLVVLDVTMTATARLAHYVFGCKLSLEKPGTSRTAEGQLDVPFAQYTPAILAPDFDVIEEWEFFWGLAHRMRTPLVLEQGDARPRPEADAPTSTSTSRTGRARAARRGAAASRRPRLRARRAGARRAGAARARGGAHGRRAAGGDRAAPCDPRRALAGRGDALQLPADQPPHARGLQLDRRPPAGPPPPLRLQPRVHAPRRSGARSASAPGDVVRIDSDSRLHLRRGGGDDRRAARASSRWRTRAAASPSATPRCGRSAARRTGSSRVERDFEPISGIPRQSAIPVNVRALDRPDELAAIAAE